MKAIIPVAGAGTRLRPHTYTHPKALIPVGGKTILAHILDSLQESGVTDFVFVVGYLGEKIKDYITKHYPHLPCSFVEQSNRAGLGEAIYLAKPFIANNEEIIIVLGDTVLEVNWKEIISLPGNHLAIKKVEDPRGFGLAEFNENQEIFRVVEKPNIPKSNYALVGLYKISNSKMLFDCLENNINSNAKTQGEFHLTDGIQCMIEQGEKFHAYRVNNWFDCGKKEVLLETNCLLLKKVPQDFDSSKYQNTVIIPPVFIGANADLSNAVIGPNASIGEGAIIKNAVISHSIIGEFAKLQDVVLHESIIGSDALVKGNRQSLNIGDNTEIDLS
jgi:glucose-1-phosphate thymidylyltransferase